MADVKTQIQIGMQVDLLRTKLFGGYNFDGNSHFFLIKQKKPEASEKKPEGYSVIEFVDDFYAAINEITGITAATPEKLKIPWPPELKAIVDPFKVVVKEVFLYVEKPKEGDGKNQFAFWIAIEMDQKLLDAIASGDPNYKDDNDVDQPVPEIFKIFRTEKLWLKIWKLDEKSPVIEEMQLEDLKQKYIEHKK